MSRCGQPHSVADTILQGGESVDVVEAEFPVRIPTADGRIGDRIENAVGTAAHTGRDPPPIGQSGGRVVDDRRVDALTQGQGEHLLLDSALAVAPVLRRGRDAVGHDQDQRLGLIEEFECEGALPGVPGPAVDPILCMADVDAVLIENDDAARSGNGPSSPGLVEGDGAQDRFGGGGHSRQTGRQGGG